MIDTSALPIKAEYVGKTRRDDWECFEWRVTISGEKNSYWTFPYYCGLGHVTAPKRHFGTPQPKRPRNDDILYSLIRDASAEQQNFHDWCSDLGYSDDSLKALNIYKECLFIATMLRKHLGRDVVAELAEQLKDH